MWIDGNFLSLNCTFFQFRLFKKKKNSEALLQVSFMFPDKVTDMWPIMTTKCAKFVERNAYKKSLLEIGKGKVSYKNSLCTQPLFSWNWLFSKLLPLFLRKLVTLRNFGKMRYLMSLNRIGFYSYRVRFQFAATFWWGRIFLTKGNVRIFAFMQSYCILPNHHQEITIRSKDLHSTHFKNLVMQKKTKKNKNKKTQNEKNMPQFDY